MGVANSVKKHVLFIMVLGSPILMVLGADETYLEDTPDEGPGESTRYILRYSRLASVLDESVPKDRRI